MSTQRRKHGRVRTWSLATLNRGHEYLLFWHEGTQSWEIVHIDKSATVVTRTDVQEGRTVRADDATEGAQRRGLSRAEPAETLTEDA